MLAQAQTSWDRRAADGSQTGSFLFVGPNGTTTFLRDGQGGGAFIGSNGTTTLYGDGRGGGLLIKPEPGILGARPRNGLLPPLD